MALRQDTIRKFEENTLRLKLESRGGGIEIDLTKYGFPAHKMTAYQNYLGGGMLGSIGSDCTKQNWRENDTLTGIAERLQKYFFYLSNENEFNQKEFDQLQQRSLSAY